MTNLQLLLIIGVPTLVPTLTVIIAFLLNQSTMNARFTDIETRLLTIKGDLRQFYKDLGRHQGKIEMLEHRQ